MISIHRSLAPAVLLSAVLLAGCWTTAFAQAPAIAVEPTTHVLLLKVRPGGKLPREEEQRVVDFLRVASGGRLDAIHLVVAGHHPAARGAVVRIARRLGVAPGRVREMEEVADEQFRFGVRIIAARFAAHAPDCPSLEIQASSGNSNDFEPALGCSSQANLAATVNDPKDLLGNSAVPPTDATRAALAVSKYQSGGATAAPAANGSR